MRTINKIIVHHSASSFGNALLINDWHKQRKWRCIGYNYVILNGYLKPGDGFSKFTCGLIETGRHPEEIPAHVKGENEDSIGICLIHDYGEYNNKQLHALKALLMKLMDIYDLNPDNIYGHYEFDDNKKQCPGINMRKFSQDLWAAYNIMHRDPEREQG